MRHRPERGRKLPCNPTEVRDVPYETAGPGRDRSPMAPPPNSPNHHLEERASEPSDPTAVSRWAHALHVTCETMKLVPAVWNIWNMLPHELQTWLIDRMLG
jgi:hypothetical protein